MYGSKKANPLALETPAEVWMKRTLSPAVLVNLAHGQMRLAHAQTLFEVIRVVGTVTQEPRHLVGILAA